MCLKAQTRHMASQLPAESIAKPIFKPLNPNAEPFHITSAATQPYCSSLLMPPHQIYGEMSQTHAQAQHQELGFPWFYGHDPSPMYLPELTGAVSGVPLYRGGGIWYEHPPAIHHPCSCSFGFHTPSLHSHPVDIHCNHPFGNEKTLEVTHVPECWADGKMGKTGKRMYGKKARWSQQCSPVRRGSTWTAAKRVQSEWKSVEKSSVGHPIIPFPATMEEAESSGITTVMIKNIPYHYQRKDLLLMLDEHCFEQNTSVEWLFSMYDFVYLPMDYKKLAWDKRLANLGYAFVNFTTARAAFHFFQQFNGHRWFDRETKKICEVTSAQFQGKEGLMKKFEEKVFRCVCPNFRPVEFTPARNGFNRRIRGISVGKYAKGLPNKSIGR